MKDTIFCGAAIAATLLVTACATCVEFSWEGTDDNTHASGRGWAALGTAGRLVGHIFIHKGNDSGFVAERE